jgi:hypothetical protein
MTKNSFYFTSYVVISIFFVMFWVVFPLTLKVAKADDAPYSCCYGGTLCDAHTTQVNCEAAGCSWNPLCDPASALEQLVELLLIFLRWLPFFGLIAGTIFLLIGGFKYLTAGDDAEEVEKAQKTIIYAIVGMILSSTIWLVARLMVAIFPDLGRYVGL